MIRIEIFDKKFKRPTLAMKPRGETFLHVFRHGTAHLMWGSDQAVAFNAKNLRLVGQSNPATRVLREIDEQDNRAFPLAVGETCNFQLVLPRGFKRRYRHETSPRITITRLA